MPAYHQDRVAPAIGFVADTINTDPEASISLLRETLTDKVASARWCRGR
jgi:hypothetical protein